MFIGTTLRVSGATRCSRASACALPASAPEIRTMRTSIALVGTTLVLIIGVQGCASARSTGTFAIPPMPALSSAQAWQLKGDSLVGTVYRSTRLVRMQAESRPGVRSAVTGLVLGSAGALATSISDSKHAKTVGEVASGAVALTSVVALVRALRSSDNQCLVDIDKATLAWDGAGKSTEPAARDAYVALRYGVTNAARACPHIGSALTVTGAGLAGF
jgi:hypothetical protein